MDESGAGDSRAAEPVPEVTGVEVADLGRFFHGAPVLAATATPDGYLSQLGGAWTEVLGWSTEELTSRPFFDFVHPDDQAGTTEALSELNRGDRVAGFVNRYRVADGGWVWLRWHAGTDDGGQIFAVAWDVSDEVAAQGELAQRTAMLEAVTRLQRSAIEADLRPEAVGAFVESLLAATGARDAVVAAVAEVDGYPVLRPVWASTGFEPLLQPAPADPDDPTDLSSGLELRDLNTLVGSVVRTGEAVRSVDPANDPRRSNRIDVDCERFLALPLAVGGDLRGVLALTDVDVEADSHTGRMLDPVTATLAAIFEQREVRRRSESSSRDLARLSNLLAAVLHDLDGLVVVSELDGTIRFVNHAAERLFGMDGADLAGCLTPAAFVVDGPGGAGPTDYLEWLRDPDHEPAEWTFAGAGGERIPVLVRPSVLNDHLGVPDGWVQLGTELTQRRQIDVERTRSAVLAEEVDLLRRRERELGLLAEATKYVMSSASIQDAVCVIRSFLPRILPADQPGIVSIAGVSCDGGHAGSGIQHEDCWALRTGSTHVSHAGRVVRCAHLPERGSFACVPLNERGQQVAALTVALPTEGGADATRGRVALQRAEDVARQLGIALSYLGLRQSLEQQASVDALTGVGNRRVAEAALDSALSAARARGEEFGLLLFDLDGFKSVNDEQGHHVGDALLCDVATTLTEGVRSGDTVARLGGDEFLVVLRNLGPSDTGRVAEVLRHRIREQVGTGVVTSCTASVGALHVSGDDLAASALMTLADDALYRAKADGRDRVAVATASGAAPGPADTP